MDHPTNDELIEAIGEVMEATIELARSVPESEADRPTDCPGWTVRDQLAHMVGLEQVLSGSPYPDVDLPPLDHVVTDLDRFMEGPVHVRRALPLAALADELTGLAPRRRDQLRALAAQGDPEVDAPGGKRPLSADLPIRVFDLWAHEQDIRRALGRPPRIEGAAAAISLGRAVLGWTKGLARKLDGVHGRLVIEVTSPEPSTVEVKLGEGGPTATLTGDRGQILAVFCGRRPPGPLLEGDPTLVAALAGQGPGAGLAMTP